MTCSVDLCDRQTRTRGYCDRHYQRLLKYGDPKGGGPLKEEPGICSVDDCNIKKYSHGFCSRHWQRYKKYGTTDLPIRPKVPTVDRFYTFIEYTPNNSGLDDCWSWKGTKNKAGYGKLRADGKNGVLAHKWSYEYFVGKVPNKLVLDHVCHTLDVNCKEDKNCPHRACANPKHLEPVTRYDNIVTRGRTSWSSVNAKKTHCVRGHLLDEENTYIYPKDKGYRHCKKCKYITNLASLTRRRKKNA